MTDWRPEKSWDPNPAKVPGFPGPKELPRGAVGWAAHGSDGHLPLYFCLKCEQKTALEGKPLIGSLIERFGADTIIHMCVDASCFYARAIDPEMVGGDP